VQVLMREPIKFCRIHRHCCLYDAPMAMGTRKQREKQEGIWIAQAEIASAPAHPFYQKLNELLEGEKFDEFVEERCAKFYAPKFGRPSPTPGPCLESQGQAHQDQDPVSLSARAASAFVRKG